MLAYVGSRISRTVDTGHPRIRPSYVITNACIGLKNDTWQAAVFVNNLFDEAAAFGDNRTLAAETFDRPRIVRNRPRTIAVDLRTNF